jgi:hypothetical protein
MHVGVCLFVVVDGDKASIWQGDTHQKAIKAISGDRVETQVKTKLDTINFRICHGFRCFVDTPAYFESGKTFKVAF